MIGNNIKTLPKRLTAVVLAVTVAMTFMPLFGMQANAADATKSYKAAQSSKMPFSVSKPNSNGIVTVKGDINNVQTADDLKFYSVKVDDRTVASNINSKTLDLQIDMKNYNVGYHDISVLYIQDGQIFYWQDMDTVEYVPTKIYSKPGNSAKLYDIYHKYMRYTYNNDYKYDTSCNVYMEYKPAKKKWKKAKTKSNMNSYTTYKISGLKPGKSYSTRTYYGKKFTYKGKSYFWKGKKSAVRKMKTGTKKMKVKSMTVKAYNVKRHTVRHYGYYTGVYLGKSYYYTYKLKATVKLKKKPGAKGIMINAYKVKGNKKVYTKKLGSFTSYVKPTKKKYTLSITSYQNNAYGGWSPRIVKTKRIKR